MAGFSDSNVAGMPEFPNCENPLLVSKIKNGVEKLIGIQRRDIYDITIRQIADEFKIYDKNTVINGLIKYLEDPERKSEFVSLGIDLPASQHEMAIVNLMQFMNLSMYNTDDPNEFWNKLLEGLDNSLFRQENEDLPPPCLDVIEAVAHFYANICKLRGDLSQLLLFVMNSMCYMSHELIPLVEVCLDVVPGLFPRSDTYVYPDNVPLLRCILFLLDSYSCDGASQRVQESHQRMKIKYKFIYTGQDENAFLFVMMASIVNLTHKDMDTTYLEWAIIILAKQRGPRWSHNNIVKRMFLPVIRGDIDAPLAAKRFCILSTGPMIKEYDDTMAAHTNEVVTELINIYKQLSQTKTIKGDIVRCLIFMDKKSITRRVNLLLRN